MANGDEEILEGLAPLPEGQFYVTWGQETLKENTAKANDVLRALLTLSASMVGGSVAFLNEKVMNQPFRGLVTGILLIALIASLVGVMPYEGTVDLRKPKEIEAHKKIAYKHKRLALRLSAGLLLLGLVAALVGLICYQPLPTTSLPLPSR